MGLCCILGILKEYYFYVHANKNIFKKVDGAKPKTACFILRCADNNSLENLLKQSLETFCL